MTPQAPSGTSPRVTLREAAAVLLLLGSVVGAGMAFAWPWRPAAAAGSDLARYVPTADGWSALYARRNADGTPRSWESQNQQVLLPGRALAGELRKAERGALERFFLRPGETKLDDAALLRRMLETTVTRTFARELAAADGKVGTTVGLGVRDERGDFLLSLYDPAADRDMVFEPAILNVPADMDVGRTWGGKGKLMGTVDYAFSGRVAGAGRFRAPAGDLPDCRRLETRLTLVNAGTALSDDRWTGWYCAGVGLVDEETRDASGQPTQRRVAASAVSLPHAPAAAPAAASAGAWSLTRVARLGQTVNASESTIVPVWSPGERPMLLAAGQGSDLVAYDAADPTGPVLWRFHPGGTVYSSPGLDPRTGRVFFGASDKRLYALDRRGLFLWSFATGDNVATRPLAVGSVVVFGSEDRTVYGVEAATGKLLWRRVTGGPVVSSPAAVGGTVAIGSDDGTVYALDAATGRELWTHDTGAAVEAPVVAEGGAFHVASRDGTVRVLSARTGRARWTAEVGNVVRAAPAVGPAAVYVVDLYGYLKAFDRATGRRLWTSPVDGYTGPAAVLDGRVFAPRSDGAVHRLDPATGRAAERWTTPAGANGRSPGFYLGASTGGGAVWLADFGANVWRLGAGTGGARPLPLAWSRMVSDAPFEMNLLTGTPVRWGARTLLLDRANHLYEVDPATGTAARRGKVAGERPAMVEPTVAGDLLLVPVANTLYAARLPGGRPAWTFRGEGMALAPATVAGGTVLWTAQKEGGKSGRESGTLYAVDLATGRLRWSHPVRGVGAVGGVAVRGGTVFLGTPATALDLATGRVLWSAPGAGSAVGSPALSARGDVLYAAEVARDGKSGSVAALGAADGRVRWRAALADGEVVNFLERLWTDGGLVIAPTLGGRVVALDAATGAERWRYVPEAPRLGAVTVQDGRVYLALQNGQVVALDAATGRPLARFSDLELNLASFSYAERPLVSGGWLLVPTGLALLGFEAP